MWGGHHFSGGAGFLLEQSEDGPVLHATLWKDDGECVDSEIPLAERIMNDDGNLVYSMSHPHRGRNRSRDGV